MLGRRARAPRRDRGRARRGPSPARRRAGRARGSRRPAARRRAAAARTWSGVARRSSTASCAAPKDCAPSETRTPRRASTSASSSSTVSGLASTVSSEAGGSPSRSRSSSGAPSSVGVPPPRKTVSSAGASRSRSCASSASTRVDVALAQVGVARHGHEVAVAAAVRAERHVHVEVPDQLGPPPRRVSWVAAARAARASASSRPRAAPELERQRRHEDVAGAVGVDDRAGRRHRLPAALAAVVGEVVTAVGAFGPDAQTRPHRQVGQVVALAAVARRARQHVDLHAARDDAREPPRGHHQHARAPRGDDGARIVAGVEDAVESRQLVPAQRILDAPGGRCGPCTRIVRSPLGSATVVTRFCGFGRRPTRTSQPSARSIRSDSAPAASSPSAVRKRVSAPSAGSARAATPPPPPGSSNVSCSCTMAPRDERLVQAPVLDPLDVPDDRDAGHMPTSAARPRRRARAPPGTPPAAPRPCR